jgi:hypothetical protein
MAQPTEYSMATRVPKSLHRRLRVFCVQRGVTVKEFVTEAVEEKLNPKVRRLPRPTARKAEE